MTNRKTPVQVGATEEQIEAVGQALRAELRPERRGSGPLYLDHDLHEYENLARAAIVALEAAATASAHTVDERHDAAERQARASSIRIEIVQEMANRAYSEYEEVSDDSYGAWSWLTEELKALRGIDPEGREAEPEDHAATVTGDRDSLAMFLGDVRHDPELHMMYQRYPLSWALTTSLRIRQHLVAPVEVDEAKLADVLVKHREAVFEWGEGVGCICGYEPRRRSETVEKHIAHAVAEWLRGEGR